MLRIIVPGEPTFNEATNELGTQGDAVLELEHSLVSVSKWEAKFGKPFLETMDKTPEELVGYIEAMVLTPGISLDVLGRLSEDNVTDINTYINAKMTATWFSDDERGSKHRGKVVTSELIYYWMIGFKINWEAQYWHLNRLFTLIRVCSAEQEKPKKMTRGQIAERNRRLNEERKRQLGTRG